LDTYTALSEKEINIKQTGGEISNSIIPRFRGEFRAIYKHHF